VIYYYNIINGGSACQLVEELNMLEYYYFGLLYFNIFNQLKHYKMCILVVIQAPRVHVGQSHSCKVQF
jgi:hypothetical protein